MPSLLSSLRLRQSCLFVFLVLGSCLGLHSINAQQTLATPTPDDPWKALQWRSISCPFRGGRVTAVAA